MISFFTSSCVVNGIFIDVNGGAKPNQISKDIFFFHVTKDEKIIPYGAPGTDSCLSGINSPENMCKMNESGLTCAYMILKDKSFKIPKN